MIIARIRLHKIYDVKSIHLVFSRVLHSEKVPLSKAIRAIVIFEVEIVFTIANFDSFFKISTLKSALKDQGLVLVSRFLQLVKRAQAFIVAV